MIVILRMKMPGLGNVGDEISVAPDRARRLVLGGIGNYKDDIPSEKRKKATIDIPKKRGRKKKEE